jgi:sortase B
LPEFDKKSSKKPPNVPEVSGGSNSGRRIIRRKESIAASIFHGLFPWKGDKVGDVVRKLIFLASLALITWAGIRVMEHYVFRPMQADIEQGELDDILKRYVGPEVVTIIVPAENDSPEAETKTVEIIGEYLEFFQMNNDFVGRVMIYPWVQHNVYQHTVYNDDGIRIGDNEFYLFHNHNRAPTINGTIFADWEGVFTETERPHNTIIYGHNLQTRGFFMPLTYYRPGAHGVDSFQFLKDHPIIRFDTLYERGHYKIFAIFQSNVREHQGEVFRYWDYVYFNNKSHFDNFVAEVLDRSLYFTNIDLEYGDELLMLSTCDFSIFANGSDSSVRLVIAARRVRNGESFLFSADEIEAFIDNRGVNEDGQLRRRMFGTYYDIRFPAGWGGRNWNPAYIKDFEG